MLVFYLCVFSSKGNNFSSRNIFDFCAAANKTPKNIFHFIFDRFSGKSWINKLENQFSVFSNWNFLVKKLTLGYLRIKISLKVGMSYQTYFHVFFSIIIKLYWRLQTVHLLQDFKPITKSYQRIFFFVGILQENES